MPGWKRLGLGLAFALACVAAGSGSAWAQEGGTRVAIVEMARILAESSAVRSIQDQGEMQRRAYAEETQRETERLRAIQDELVRQGTVLAPEALEERQRAFNAEVAAADQEAQARIQALQRAVEQGELRFREALDAVVAEVAEREGFDLVLPVHVSLFAVDQFDLTDRVIERLNETYPEIALSFDGG